MIHELKTWPQYFIRVLENTKRFEVRKNDRDYQVGDVLSLKEYDPIRQEYTGNELRFMVDYILHGGNFGIESGYCIMSIHQIS